MRKREGQTDFLFFLFEGSHFCMKPAEEAC
jgi:hypothetical protein